MLKVDESTKIYCKNRNQKYMDFGVQNYCNNTKCENKQIGTCKKQK